MKLCLLTKYSVNGPSSRYRFLQYLPELHDAGFRVSVYPFFDDTYLRRLFAHRRANPFYVVWRILNRIGLCLAARRFDIVWIEGELLPFFPAWLERLLHPFLPRCRFYDFDDAIWLRYQDRSLLRGKFLKTLKTAAGITAGNRFLAEDLAETHRPTLILPTVVRWERYAACQAPLCGSTIGWIGTPQTVFFLERLLPALTELTKTHTFTLHVIGATVASDTVAIECRAWSQTEETALLSQIDIGVMPLDDDAWSRGKCGLKLIQYLAAGVPAVASPVGVNTQIIRDSGGGFLARDTQQWVAHLGHLLDDAQQRKAMGARARHWVREHMTVDRQVPNLIAFLRSEITSTPKQADASKSPEIE